MELINKGVADKALELNKKFIFGKPYKHILIKDFLQEDKAKEIFGALKKEKFDHKESDLFSLNQTEDLKFSQNEVLKKFYKFFSSKEFGEWIMVISGIKLKIGEIDMAGSLYDSCDYLLCHDDRLENRKIAFVYYLNKSFNEKDGGSFVMFDSEKGKPWRVSEKYLPLWNSLLIFEVSDKSFHEVEENYSDKKRYAVGGWFH